MHRLFCLSTDVKNGKITVSDYELLHHLRDVLRVRPGEKVIACDNKGNVFDCILEASNQKEMILGIKEEKPACSNRKLKLTAACAIPKNSRFDDIIDKLTQVGVDKIIPMVTERVIVKLDKRKEQLRLSRWQKISLSAAEQSQRCSLPEISPLKDFAQVLEESAKQEYDLKLIPCLGPKRKILKEALAVGKPENVIYLIGPEGDFTDTEVSQAIAAGFIPVSLGELVLRVETAAVVVASFIRLFEDRDGS